MGIFWGLALGFGIAEYARVKRNEAKRQDIIYGYRQKLANNLNIDIDHVIATETDTGEVVIDITPEGQAQFDRHRGLRRIQTGPDSWRFESLIDSPFHA